MKKQTAFFLQVALLVAASAAVMRSNLHTHIGAAPVIVNPVGEQQLSIYGVFPGMPAKDVPAAIGQAAKRDKTFSITYEPLGGDRVVKQVTGTELRSGSHLVTPAGPARNIVRLLGPSRISAEDGPPTFIVSRYCITMTQGQNPPVFTMEIIHTPKG